MILKSQALIYGKLPPKLRTIFHKSKDKKLSIFFRYSDRSSVYFFCGYFNNGF